MSGMTTEDIIEIFGLLGSPARLFGRLPLVTRYVWNGFTGPLFSESYAKARYGRHWRWRPWLMFDMMELEALEELINRGTDKNVLAFRRNQIQASQMVSIVGALVAGTALTSMQLPGLDQVSYVARGFFYVSFVEALLATFTTCLQQRTYGFLDEPPAIRAWLANGVRYIDAEGRQSFQSSIISHCLLQVPFELLCISITAFLGGIGVFLGSTFTQGISFGIEPPHKGNLGVLIAYIVSTSFALCLLGQLLGSQDVEKKRCRNLKESFAAVHGNPLRNEEAGMDRSWPGMASLSAKECDQSKPPALSIHTSGLSPPEVQHAHRFSFSGRDADDYHAQAIARALQRAAEAHQATAAAEAEVARLYRCRSEHLLSLVDGTGLSAHSRTSNLEDQISVHPKRSSFISQLQPSSLLGGGLKY